MNTAIQNSKAKQSDLSSPVGGVEGAAPPFWAGLKFFNVYGPNEGHKGRMASVIWHSFNQIKKTGQVKLFKSHRPEYKDGWQLRDFIYVKDILKVMYWMFKSVVGNQQSTVIEGQVQAAGATIYDLPNSEDDVLLTTNDGDVSNNEHATDCQLPTANYRLKSAIYNLGTGTARSFYDLAAATFRGLDREPDIVFIDMPEDIRDKYQYFTQADMHKLRAAGYTEPFYTLEDGVNDYVRHYLAKGMLY